MQQQGLLAKAQPVLEYQGEGQLTTTQAATMKFDAGLFLGSHHVPTVVAGATYMSAHHPTTPIVCTGGLGLGTIFMLEGTANHLLIQGLAPLQPADCTSEAAIMSHLLRELGLQNQILLEPTAPHTAANFKRSIQLLEQLKAYPGGKILVIQAACNRRRARVTGEQCLPEAEMYTLHLPVPDLSTLGERDLVIELYRLLGLPKTPASELRVCETFAPAVLAEMPPDLQIGAKEAERQFHEWLAASPRLLDHVRDALLGTPKAVGGVK